MTTAPELDLMAPPATSTAAGPSAIEIHGLRKRFGHTDVLEGIDLTVPRNSVFGFLGPNGAGKSTTMKILVGLLRPTSGTATVAGHDVRHDGVEARASIGYLPQDVTYWRHLSVRDVLGFTARRYLHGSRRALVQRVDETIELAGLGALEKRKVGKLSGGERQRLGVAEAWVGRPEVLILDEPSAGLDPEGRHEVLDLLDRLREEATIFYSTHILDDIERVSDTIAVLSRGHIVAQGPTQDFLMGDTTVYSIACGDRDRGVVAFAELGAQPWVDSVHHVDDGTWEVAVSDRQRAEHELMRILVGRHDLPVDSFRPSRRSLEDIYLELVTEAEIDDGPADEEVDHDG
jgi:ABC-2 type transport system ATP-binding protein